MEPQINPIDLDEIRLLHDALAEIARLRQEDARMRAALQDFMRKVRHLTAERDTALREVETLQRMLANGN